jgi:hypothetical protein
MEFYSATMKNKIMSLAGKCMELQLSEVKQTQEGKYSVFCIFFNLENKGKKR